MTTNEPIMFHYLLEMHKAGGVRIMHLEMNVPVVAFPAVRMNSLLSLETMLLDYGEAQGFKRSPAGIGDALETPAADLGGPEADAGRLKP